MQRNNETKTGRVQVENKIILAAKKCLKQLRVYFFFEKFTLKTRKLRKTIKLKMFKKFEKVKQFYLYRFGFVFFCKDPASFFKNKLF